MNPQADLLNEEELNGQMRVSVMVEQSGDVTDINSDNRF
jgi:hypothetical protein